MIVWLRIEAPLSPSRDYMVRELLMTTSNFRVDSLSGECIYSVMSGNYRHHRTCSVKAEVCHKKLIRR